MQRYQDEPLEIGMRIKPQTREQRRIGQDRDYQEKQRVSQRCENFERHEEAQFTNDQYNEHHRFGDSFEELERRKKEIKKQQKQEYLQMIGQQARQRDQMYIERDVEQERKKIEFIQQRGCQKNVSGEKFNILTREYHNPEDQKFENDQLAGYHQAAAARQNNLIQKSGGGINILTGEQFSWAKK
ncbi:Conserved_hypothetical protein [Hexamita inflata]|uniref:Uncharacterized protein n=1 Tax=Hexamita inflata TaxID=28002 RepID=A0ABP1HLE2_9EUKA